MRIMDYDDEEWDLATDWVYKDGIDITDDVGQLIAFGVILIRLELL